MRILTWPLRMLFLLIGFIFNLTGRLVCFALGLALLVAGAALTFTFIAAIIGIPLIILGGSLIVRALF